MLEESIGSSPQKADSSIHRARMRRRNKQRQRLDETFDCSASTTSLPTASATNLKRSSKSPNELQQPRCTLADMYWEQDEAGSAATTRAVPACYDPFEDQMLLLAADRLTSTQQGNTNKSKQPATTGFQKCEFLTESVSCHVREETQNEISDMEMLQIWEQVEAAAKQDEKLNTGTCDVETTPPQPPPETQTNKSIVDLILEDFGCSPLSPPMEFKRSLRTYSRRRLKKADEVATAAGEYLATTRLSFAQQLEKVAAATSAPSDEDDCLSICSTSSSLSMQADRTQLLQASPALLDANVLNRSQKLYENLLNLSAYFTQQSQSEKEVQQEQEAYLTPTTSDTNMSASFRTAIAERADEIESCTASVAQHAAFSQPLAEILTLRQKYPVSFSRRSSRSSADFVGFPPDTATTGAAAGVMDHLAINASQTSHSSDVACRSQNSENKITPAQYQKSQNVHKDEPLFSDNNEWPDVDCDFFANFKTQDALQAVTTAATNLKADPAKVLHITVAATTAPTKPANAAHLKDAPACQTHTAFASFQTAAPKNKQVSAAAKCAAQLLQELPDLPFKMESNMPKFLGFQTASRKTIQIAEESRKLAEAMVAAVPEVKDLNDDDQPSTSKAAALKTASRNSAVNTKPAYKKPTCVGVKAKIEQLQRRDQAVVDRKTNFKEDFAVHVENPMPQFPGFCTASRKTIKISAEAERRAASILTELPEIPQKQEKVMPPVIVEKSCTKIAKSVIDVENPMPQFAGFCTASRKTIKISAEAERRAASILTELPEIPQKQEKVMPPVIFEKSCAKIVKPVIETAALIAEEFRDIQFSEWPLTQETAARSQEIAGDQIVAESITAAVKRKLHNEDEIVGPDSKFRKSLPTASLQRSPLHHIENATELRCSPVKTVIISRRNLLSLSKRKKSRPPSTGSITQGSANPSPNTVTPIKSKSDNYANVQTPATPNLREFFDSLPTNTSTPRPFKDATMPRALDLVDEREEQQTKVADYKQNPNQSGNVALRSRLEVTSKFDATHSKSFNSTGGNGMCNVSLNASASKPSPKERIERLRMYGKPPAVSPILMAGVNNCRPSGLRRSAAGRGLMLNKSKK